MLKIMIVNISAAVLISFDTVAAAAATAVTCLAIQILITIPIIVVRIFACDHLNHPCFYRYKISGMSYSRDSFCCCLLFVVSFGGHFTE